MDSPEVIVLMLNCVIVAIAYFFIYPVLCGDDINRIVANDFCSSVMSLGICGFLFWGEGIAFNTIFFDSNRFWFTLISYAVIEFPMFIFYATRHGLWDQLKNT